MYVNVVCDGGAAQLSSCKSFTLYKTSSPKTTKHCQGWIQDLEGGFFNSQAKLLQ